MQFWNKGNLNKFDAVIESNPLSNLAHRNALHELESDQSVFAVPVPEEDRCF